MCCSWNGTAGCRVQNTAFRRWSNRDETSRQPTTCFLTWETWGSYCRIDPNGIQERAYCCKHAEICSQQEHHWVWGRNLLWFGKSRLEWLSRSPAGRPGPLVYWILSSDSTQPQVLPGSVPQINQYEGTTASDLVTHLTWTPLKFCPQDAHVAGVE